MSQDVKHRTITTRIWCPGQKESVDYWYCSVTCTCFKGLWKGKNGRLFVRCAYA